MYKRQELGYHNNTHFFFPNSKKKSFGPDSDKLNAFSQFKEHLQLSLIHILEILLHLANSNSITPEVYSYVLGYWFVTIIQDVLNKNNSRIFSEYLSLIHICILMLKSLNSTKVKFSCSKRTKNIKFMPLKTLNSYSSRYKTMRGSYSALLIILN